MSNPSFSRNGVRRQLDKSDVSSRARCHLESDVSIRARRRPGSDVSSRVQRQLANYVRPGYPRVASFGKSPGQEGAHRGAPLGPSKSLPSPLIALLDDTYTLSTIPKRPASGTEAEASAVHQPQTPDWRTVGSHPHTPALDNSFSSERADEDSASCSAGPGQSCSRGLTLPCGSSSFDERCTGAAGSSGTFPSGAILAELLVAYHRQLEQENLSGDVAAAAGGHVLGRVKAGLEKLLWDPCHGASPHNSEEWHEAKEQVQGFLREIEKDVCMMGHYHNEKPPRFALAFTGMHCLEAARLLKKL